MIYGERIRLRGIDRTDLPNFVAWINDPEVHDGLGVFLPISNADEEKWFEHVTSGEPAEKPLAIEIRDGDGWRMIGNSSFMGIEWFNRQAEIGIMLGDKTAWNLGYGTEAMLLLLRHGFETLNLNRIWLRVHGDNPRARHVYEKIGFTLEGCLRHAAFKHNKYVDVYIMSILHSEWDAQKR